MRDRAESFSRQRRSRFRDEFRDFLRFVIRPTLGPRLAPRPTGGQIKADWLSGLKLGYLLKWALFLWGINLVFLGPIAVAAATAAGAEHRLNLQAIPWMQALLWAPIVEELVFRYSLRRIGQALWVVPVSVGIMLTGPTMTSILILSAVLFVCWSPRYGSSRLPSPQRSQGRSWSLRVRYRALFPWVFHAASLAFAGVHLHNFNLPQTAIWLLPLLVLPQWLTGLVLGWLRVRHGIGASMFLHGLFNGGPLLLVWLLLRLAPEMAL